MSSSSIPVDGDRLRRDRTPHPNARSAKAIQTRGARKPRPYRGLSTLAVRPRCVISTRTYSRHGLRSLDRTDPRQKMTSDDSARIDDTSHPCGSARTESSARRKTRRPMIPGRGEHTARTNPISIHASAGRAAGLGRFDVRVASRRRIAPRRFAGQRTLGIGSFVAESSRFAAFRHQGAPVVSFSMHDSQGRAGKSKSCLRIAPRSG
jgi:hypothetical protein